MMLIIMVDVCLITGFLYLLDMMNMFQKSRGTILKQPVTQVCILPISQGMMCIGKQDGRILMVRKIVHWFVIKKVCLAMVHKMNEPVVPNAMVLLWNGPACGEPEPTMML